MAWIESHQSLRLHPKTLFVCSALKAKRHAVIGHLQCLWWWALDVADLDGWLPAGTNSLTVAGGAEWPEKNADSFLKALLAAGFLDEEKGRYKLHDWWDFAGKYNAKRAANKERMRSARATHVQGLPTNLPEQPNQPTNQNQPAEEAAAAFKSFEDCIGSLSAYMARKVEEDVTEFGSPCVIHCLEEAAANNKRSLKYAESIMKRHQAEGCFSEQRNGRRDDEAEWLATRYAKVKGEVTA